MKSRIQVIKEAFETILEGAKRAAERSKSRAKGTELYLSGRGPTPMNPEQAAQVMDIIGMVVRHSQARREQAKKLRGMRAGQVKSGGTEINVAPEIGKKLAQDYLSRVRW